MANHKDEVGDARHQKRVEEWLPRLGPKPEDPYWLLGWRQSFPADEIADQRRALRTAARQLGLKVRTYVVETDTPGIERICVADPRPASEYSDAEHRWMNETTRKTLQRIWDQID